MSRLDRNHKIVLLGILLLYIVAQVPLWGYVTDDTYIHLAYAHNLLLGKGWVFNSGEPSYGSTSPLWILLLAPFAGGEAAGILAARLLGIIAGLLAIVVFFRLARMAISRPVYQLTATLFMATEVWFLRWSATGMESALAVLLLLLFFERLATSPFKRRGSFVIGLLCGLCSLTRPEFYMLNILLLGLALFSPRWRRHWFSLLGGMALVLLPWLLFAHSHLGGAFPTTAAAKSRGFQGWGQLLSHTIQLLKTPVSSQGVLLLLAGAGSLHCLGSRKCRRSGHPRRSGRKPTPIRFYALLALLWGAGLPAVFIIGDVQVISRYLLPVTPLLPLAALYFLDLWSDEHPRLLRVLPILIVLTLGPNIWLMSKRVVHHARQFPIDLELGLGEFANYLKEHSAADARIAAPDIGLLGYRSERYIVDLGGLIHPDIASHWHETGYREMMESCSFLELRSADYLVDRASEPASLPAQPREGVFLFPVKVQKVEALGIRNPEPLYYTLYRIGRGPAVEESLDIDEASASGPGAGEHE
ncbi:MAG: hypothetical protein GY835_20800 [bacterium]|nr:hypothetical protein [bacterium]